LFWSFLLACSQPVLRGHGVAYKTPKVTAITEHTLGDAPSIPASGQATTHSLSTPVSLIAFPIFLGLIFWPFLWLYGYARDALIEHPSSEKSLRLATIMSVTAMSLPCSLLSFSAAAGGGQGTGILAFLFLIFLPLPGILGWFIGRAIVWILEHV
jgi:hypothetical protein